MKTILAVLATSAALVAFIAFQNASSQSTVARADDRPDAATKIKQLEDKVAALEASQQKLLQRLHDLEFPELRRRDADEIRVLKVQVEATKAEHDRIAAFRKAKVIGGETPNLVGAAYRLAVARAELAWVERRINDAVQHTAEAAVYAEERFRFYHSVVESGVAKVGNVVISVSEFGEVLEARSRARLAIVRALAVADHAKVDASGVEIEIPSSRWAGQVKSLSDVLEFLQRIPAE